ncbi:LOW QUALITY PROTEIN: Retrotransposon Polyprotein [Phytophthora palmivora]|uniref:Retrotransposon Polyprotein n=1 Tax=Phytophthora palmivora TaxID=4796 RepID=A0A2P4XNV9_9STRA|nr:LOW QUALITY PROTEIN: Retrotransposon Polyprotein [Phytophthora palmivora]
MHESDVPLMAVSTSSGMLWEWLVMPQGLKNAPATFNRCVTHLLRSVRECAPSYFDDVFVDSRAVNGKTDIEMHRVHLRKLLELMRKHKLYAILKKCISVASEIPVLWCLVENNGVRPDLEKVIVINEWPTPPNVKELKQYLGLATYLCKYVENDLGKSARCRSFSKRKIFACIWTADCQQAFDAVNQGLTEAPILAVADQDRPFHVVCDASDFAIGCALMQLDHEGRNRVVYYQSLEARNYPVHDKERLAMKYALAKFRVYLLGNTPFMVYTDYASLLTDVKSPHITRRMARWLSFFAELNVVADALPRRLDYTAKTSDVNRKDLLPTKLVGSYQLICVHVHTGIVCMKDCYFTVQLKTMRSALSSQVIMTCASGSCTSITIINECDVCQRVKPAPFSQAPLQSLPTPSECWKSVSMDFMFGLPRDSKRKTSIVVFVDRVSKRFQPK